MVDECSCVVLVLMYLHTNACDVTHTGGYISGSGESELRVIRARILHQRRLLEDQLQHVKRTRQVQRAGRKKSGLLVVALVGYTNAGAITPTHEKSVVSGSTTSHTLYQVF